MRKLRIYLDQDGVLADLHTKLLDTYNADHNLSVQVDDITDWDLRKIQKKGTNMMKYFSQKGFFRDLPLIDGAKDGVSSLLTCGHDVLVATSSPKDGMFDKNCWLDKHFPDIKARNRIMITRKNLLTGDILLDDAIHNLTDAGVDYPVLFDKPWNRGDDRFIRVFDWSGFLNVVDAVGKGIDYQSIRRTYR